MALEHIWLWSDTGQSRAAVSMLTKIILKNYMSHAQTELDLAPGVNVIIGPNNSGKSAIVSALQTVLGDNEGDFMVRHGQKECVVEVHTDDPHVVAWRRRGRSVSYQIDGRDIARAGRNLPDDLQVCLRLSAVNSNDGKDSFDVHFGLQKSPIFLIQSESETARFFSTSSDAERLLAMQRRHRDNTLHAKEQHKTLVRKQEHLTVRLSTLNTLNELEIDLDNADDEDKALGVASALIDEFRAAIAGLESTSFQHNKLQRFVCEYTSMDEPPLLSDTVPLEQLVRALEQAKSIEQRFRSEHGGLVALNEPPSIQETESLATAIRDLESSERSERFHRLENNVLGILDAPPPLAITEMLDRDIQQIARVEIILTRANRLVERLVELAEPPELVDWNSLDLLVTAIDNCSVAVAHENRRNQALCALADVPEFVVTEPLATLTGAFDEALADWNRTGAEAASLEMLSEPPFLMDTISIAETIGAIDKAERPTQYLKARLTLLSDLRETEPSTDPSWLDVMINSIERAKGQVDGLLLTLQELDKDQAHLEGDMRVWCQENPTCPMCGQLVAPDQVMVETAEKAIIDHGHS